MAVAHVGTVPLYNSKVFMHGSCPILALTKDLGRPLRTDAKNEAKNYQGPTISRGGA